MQTTPNFAFKKRELTDSPPDITLTNSNWDTLDAELKPTADPSKIPTGLNGKVSDWVNWFTNRIKAITGKTNWWDAPDITLASLITHAARHQPGGADAIPTAAPSGGLGTANAAGSSTSSARADHAHLAFDSTAPVMDGAASAGSATIAARRDHRHPTDTSRAAQADLATHLAESTPHRFTDTGTGKTYRWGMKAVNGVAVLVYEEVI